MGLKTPKGPKTEMGNQCPQTPELRLGTIRVSPREKTDEGLENERRPPGGGGGGIAARREGGKRSVIVVKILYSTGTANKLNKVREGTRGL